MFILRQLPLLPLPLLLPEVQIAAAQAQKQEAQAGLDQTQANISGLESKKQELESYLSELNSQYNELTESISQLSTQAAEKEDEQNKVKVALASAQKAAVKELSYFSYKHLVIFLYTQYNTFFHKINTFI